MEAEDVEKQSSSELINRVSNSDAWRIGEPGSKEEKSEFGLELEAGRVATGIMRGEIHTTGLSNLDET